MVVLKYYHLLLDVIHLQVLIHGNPETDAIWTDLVCELTDRSVTDLVLLSPPGFGASIPDGWGATQLESRDWLIAEL